MRHKLERIPRGQISLRFSESKHNPLFTTIAMSSSNSHEYTSGVDKMPWFPKLSDSFTLSLFKDEKLTHHLIEAASVMERDIIQALSEGNPCDKSDMRDRLGLETTPFNFSKKSTTYQVHELAKDDERRLVVQDSDTAVFLKAYPALGDNTAVEVEKLRAFANFMDLVFNTVTPKNNKTFLMGLIPRICEGRDAKYVTGSGETKQCANRVLLYRSEGNCEKVSRPPRKRAKAQKDGAARPAIDKRELAFLDLNYGPNSQVAKAIGAVHYNESQLLGIPGLTFPMVVDPKTWASFDLSPSQPHHTVICNTSGFPVLVAFPAMDTMRSLVQHDDQEKSVTLCHADAAISCSLNSCGSVTPDNELEPAAGQAVRLSAGSTCSVTYDGSESEKVAKSAVNGPQDRNRAVSEGWGVPESYSLTAPLPAHLGTPTSSSLRELLPMTARQPTASANTLYKQRASESNERSGSTEGNQVLMIRTNLLPSKIPSHHAQLSNKALRKLDTGHPFTAGFPSMCSQQQPAAYSPSSSSETRKRDTHGNSKTTSSPAALALGVSAPVAHTITTDPRCDKDDTDEDLFCPPAPMTRTNSNKSTASNNSLKSNNSTNSAADVSVGISGIDLLTRAAGLMPVLR